MKECACFKACGGCQYLDISYAEQLEIKQKQEEKILGHFHYVSNIIGCCSQYYYRNKAQVSFGYDERHRIICGTYVEKSHFIVENSNCLIIDERISKIINTIKKLVISFKLPLFDEYTLKGFLRHVLVRTSKNEVMVVFVTGCFTFPKKNDFIKELLKRHPEITTIIQAINSKHTSMILDNRFEILYGKGYITDKLCGLNFNISANSFYQVNRFQTEVLYETALKLAELNKDEVVLDAYCGTGTIGLVASKYVKKVIGVEINKQAIRDAIKNMKQNDIHNEEFVNADASDYLNHLANENKHLDTIIMDPPRNGSDSKFLNALTRIKPQKIVYISCGPISLARDLKHLVNNGYQIKTIQPVDMFPNTNHVETVVLMSRDKE